MKVEIEVRGKPETREFAASIDASGRSRPANAVTSVSGEIEWGDGDILPIEVAVYHPIGQAPQGLVRGAKVTVIASSIEASKRAGAKNRLTVKEFVEFDPSRGVVPSSTAGKARSA